MTDEERKQEGADEEIEDLEAPAAAQGDVVGGGCIDHISLARHGPAHYRDMRNKKILVGASSRRRAEVALPSSPAEVGGDADGVETEEAPKALVAAELLGERRFRSNCAAPMRPSDTAVTAATSPCCVGERSLNLLMLCRHRTQRIPARIARRPRARRGESSRPRTSDGVSRAPGRGVDRQARRGSGSTVATLQPRGVNRR